MSDAAVVHIIGGNDRGKQHDLERPETRIGRGTDQDVVLADIAVSRRHVTIVTEGSRFRLKDLGSGNGSLVNGQRVDSVLLNDGDQIEIGNTLMRFDHAGSRPLSAGSAPPLPPPPMVQPAPPAPSAAGLSGGYPGHPQRGQPPSNAAYGAPPPAYPHNYPPAGYPHAGYPPPPSSGPETGALGQGASPPIAMPVGAAPSYAGPPAGVRGGDATSFVATTLGKAAVFGGCGLVSLIGLVVILGRTVFASAPPANNEAEDFYRQGLRLFAGGDYELARTKFNDVVQLAADAPEPRRYARLCDQEMTAKGSMKNAERAILNRRWVEAVRALDAIDSTSVYYDGAIRNRHEVAPKAAGEMVEDARRLYSENRDESLARTKAALELDPENIDARQLLGRLRPGDPAAASAMPMVPPGPPPSAATVAAVSRSTTPQPGTRKAYSRRPTKGDGDDADLVDVKLVRGKAPSSAAVPEVKAGMAAYKARDFKTAATAYRQESMRQPEKQAAKLLEFASEVGQLQQLLDRAATDEARSPALAMKEYEQATTLDQKLSRGALSGYLKQKTGSLGMLAAKQSFSDGKYEQAYQAALAAQRGGSDVSASLKQLDQKASDLIAQGQVQQKSNVTQAKQTWRVALHMVPLSSPTYTRAYSLINSTGVPKRDEDED